MAERVSDRMDYLSGEMSHLTIKMVENYTSPLRRLIGSIDRGLLRRNYKNYAKGSKQRWREQAKERNEVNENGHYSWTK